MAQPVCRTLVAGFLGGVKYSPLFWLEWPPQRMSRLCYHWLICMMMALLLAFAPPVAAGGHQGDAACLENLATHAPQAWDLAATAETAESHPTAASPCCMPCAQCGATMARLIAEAAVSSSPLPGPGLGYPLGPPAPFERPPRA